MLASLDLIKSRKSVRSFDDKKITEEDRRKLEQYAASINNPFDIPVRFVFLDSEEHGLSSPVLTGEKLFVAGIAPKIKDVEVAYGFSFEKLVLYAWSIGIGTTWIGGTMKRSLFENAVGLKKNEMMPCVSPLGYPAKKQSVREKLMRKGIGADNRMSAEKIFFDGSLDCPLVGKKQEEIKDLIEMVRWAPSAVNKQPWRIVRKDGEYHFYEKKNRGYIGDTTGDLQKIDVGIALCHFIYGIEESGKKMSIAVSDPGIIISEDMEYIATVNIETDE